MARGLLFEGNILAYDPASNEAEWVPMWGMAEDLSQAEASTRELSSMVPLDSAEEAQNLDQFREQRSESGGEIGAEECPTEAPCKECMNQGHEGDSDEEGSDSTPDDSCFPASSQGSACHTCRYSLGCCPGGVSWADQCLSEDEGDPVSGGEEHTSCMAIDRDRGEETLTALQDEQRPTEEPLEEMGEPDGTVDTGHFTNR